jgi:hypothetical protein
MRPVTDPWRAGEAPGNASDVEDEEMLLRPRSRRRPRVVRPAFALAVAVAAVAGVAGARSAPAVSAAAAPARPDLVVDVTVNRS